jgi:hypothetical protein
VVPDAVDEEIGAVIIEVIGPAGDELGPGGTNVGGKLRHDLLSGILVVKTYII